MTHILLRYANPLLIAVTVSMSLCILFKPTDIAHSQKKPSKRASALKAMSAAQVTRAFTLRDFGSHVVKFGRLTPDGSVSAIFVQVDRKRNITCITAMSLIDGSILWQRGTPNQRNFDTSGDIPVQVYDWNQDNIDDVIFYENEAINILSGADGSSYLSAPVEEPYSLFIYQTKQFEGRAGLVLHGRTFTTLLSPDLTTVWRHSNGFSHFPMAFDIDGDEEPELLAGYILFKSDGNILWNRTELRAHNDAADFGDVDCDGAQDLAIATSNRSALLKTSGEILWRGREYHSQHVTIGSFLPGTCEKQIATIDRDQDQKGILRLYNRQGELLWQLSGHGNRTMMTKIEGWIPGIAENLLLIFRSKSAPPTIYDGAGRVVAQLPFQPSLRRGGTQRTFSHYFVQHFDFDSDGKEEVFVSNERSLWIYTNNAIGLSTDGATPVQALPNQRIFNSTFYMGMQ
jgi:hypothetical protein